MIVQLKSIASVIDTRTKIVYAAYQKGGYDISSGVPHDKLSKLMRESMSEADRKTFKLWTRKFGIIQKVLYLCSEINRKFKK